MELLTRWKTAHEGSNGPALATLGPVDEDTLTELLLSVFTPRVERLQQIADQLEETGTLTAGTVAQLRQVVDVLASTRADPSARTAAMLSHAADVFSTRAFQNTAASLSHAADILPSYDRILKTRVAQMQHAADIISATGGRSRRYGSQ